MTSKTQFPVVYIATLAFQKLTYYYKFAKGNEISGLGKTTADDDGNVTVHDVMIFEQVSTTGDTELSPDALAAWMHNLIIADQDPSEYRLWFHKHPIDGWSGIDERNIEGLKNDGWLLSIVHTPKGWLARLDLYKPFRVTLDQLQIVELRENDRELGKRLEEEVKEKVKFNSYVMPTYTPGSYGGYGQGWQQSQLGDDVKWKGGVYKWQNGRYWKKMEDGSYQLDESMNPPTTSSVELAPKVGSKKNTKETKRESIEVGGVDSPIELTPTEMAERDEFFAALADAEWEKYYSWE